MNGIQWIDLVVNISTTLGIGGAIAAAIKWVKSKNAPSVAETWNRLTASALEDADRRAREVEATATRRAKQQDRRIAFCERRCYRLMAGWEDEVDAYDTLLSRLAARNLIETADLEAALTARRERLREAKQMHFDEDDHDHAGATPTD